MKKQSNPSHSIGMKKEDLLKEIENLSDYTDMEKWMELKKGVEILNIYDEDNKPIFKAAMHRGLI